MDDLAWGDLACHGNPHTNTPHLDRMHGESTRLTRYCSGTLCTPARASLMTGRYPQRTRAFDTYLGRSMLDPAEVTLAQVLKGAGYTTGIFGKWHLGDTYPIRPCDKGFDESLVHGGGGIGQWGDHPDNWNRDSYFDPTLIHNGTAEQRTGYCTDIFGDATVDFIKANRERPFFAYMATNAPHSPFQIDDEWADPYRAAGLPDKWARLYGMVENIDDNVGKILDTLDELSLADDTLVIYTSDHGPCPSSAIDGKHRFNAGLRGAKGSMYEGGIHVPCFWRWRGTLDAGYDIDRVANPIDILPTLAKLARTKMPDVKLDGTDLSPLLLGELVGADWPDRQFVMQWHRGDVPIAHRNSAVIGQRFKLYRPAEDKPDELYDIEADPHETQNIAAENAERVAAMNGFYDAWFADVAGERGAGTFQPPRIRIGTPHENPTLLSRNDQRVIGADGWGDRDLAYWLIDVANVNAYNLHVHVPPLDTASTLHLKCGNVELSQSLAPKQQSHQWSTVALPAGEQRLDSWLELDGNPEDRMMVRGIQVGAV